MKLGVVLNIINLESCEIVYNETVNEIRILINSTSSGPHMVIFSPNQNSLELFLENLESPEARGVAVMAQPMKTQTLEEFDEIEEDEPEDEDPYFLSYRLNDTDLTSQYMGEPRMVEIGLDSETRKLLKHMIWGMGEILDYVFGL
jgi:hypothetical protein